MKPRIQLRQPAFAYVTAFMLGLQLVDPSRVWMILLVVFGGTLLLAYIWARSLGRNLQLRRERHIGWVRAGGQIEERFTVSNHSFFPALWLELNDLSTLPGYEVDTTLSLHGGEFKQWSTPGSCNQRGLYYLGGADLITGDPFGIYQVTVHDPTRTSLIVLPHVAQLPNLEISPAGWYGEAQPRRNAPHQTINAAGVREHQPEDSLRFVHWPTTARMNKTFVKLMENASEGTWWLLLDLDRRAMLGRGWDSVEEQSVALAASLADFGLLARKSVGLISNGFQPTWLTPKKDEAQRWEILHALALVRPGETRLSTFMDRTNTALGRNLSLILITASLDLDWMTNILSLKARGIIPTVFMLDPATFGGSRSSEAAASVLREGGVTCHVIPRGMIQRPVILPEKQPEWTWRETASGQVIPIRSAQRMAGRNAAE